MSDETIERVVRMHAETPMLGPKKDCAPKASLEEMQAQLGCKFSSSYRTFLEKCQSGIVGPLPIYGSVPIDYYDADGTVVDVTSRFRADKWPTSELGPVISVDQGGNPIVETQSGKIVCQDHDFGGLFDEADTFLLFLEKLMDR